MQSSTDLDRPLTVVRHRDHHDWEMGQCETFYRSMKVLHLRKTSQNKALLVPPNRIGIVPNFRPMRRKETRAAASRLCLFPSYCNTIYQSIGRVNTCEENEITEERDNIKDEVCNLTPPGVIDCF